MVPEDAPVPIEQAPTERCRQAAVSHAAALRRARAERAGLVQLPAQAPNATYPLDQTG